MSTMPPSKLKHVSKITLRLDMPQQSYSLPTNTPLLANTNLLASKTKRRPCLLSKDSNTKFIRMSGTNNTLLKVRSLLDFIFKLTFPLLLISEEVEFPMINLFSIFNSFKVGEHSSVITYMFGGPCINLPFCCVGVRQVYLRHYNRKV